MYNTLLVYLLLGILLVIVFRRSLLEQTIELQQQIAIEYGIFMDYWRVAAVLFIATAVLWPFCLDATITRKS